MFRNLLTALLVTGGVLTCLAPSSLEAQYFGRNKVQYRSFDFEVLETPHFDIYYYPEKRESAMDAARMVERAYGRLSTVLQHRFRERKPIILYASHSDFQQTNAISDFIGEGVGAFAESVKNRVVIPFTGSYADFEQVLTHELVHTFQFDVLYRRGMRTDVNPFGGTRYPLWFMEGMAEYLSIGEVDPLTEAWLRDAVFSGYLRSIEEMSQWEDYLSYRFGQSLFAYIGSRWGDEVIGLLLQRTARQGLERAFRSSLGVSLDDLSHEWMASVRRTYLPDLVERQRPEEFAQRLTDRERIYDPWYLAPSISPDGSRMVFISQREIFFDIWLADARTGEVERKLVGSVQDPDFESVRFLNSSAAFSPDGRYIAFSAQTGGRDALYIYDVERRRQVKRLRFPLNGIVNPSWSPDGKEIAFTGLDGGVSDLFITDLNGELRRLTNDRYAALLPAWSPDGSTIAFSTDRGSDLDRLSFSNLQVALYHLDSDQVEILPHQDKGKNHNPVWAPGGGALIWVSDRLGTNDLYLFELETQELSRLTDFLTGAIAVTPLSPVLSWAQDDGRLLFVYFEEAGYNIYAVDDPLSLPRIPVTQVLPTEEVEHPERVAAEPADPAEREEDGFSGSFYRDGDQFRLSSIMPELPSTERRIVSVRALLDDSDLSLPDTADFRTRDYEVRFTPDMVGMPDVGVEVGGHYGNNVFGGGLIALSDILGNHNILVAGSVDGTISDAEVFLGYGNLRNRANYHIAFQQQPFYHYRGTGYVEERSSDGGVYAYFADQYIRDLNRQLGGLISYPFSTFRRFEFGASAISVRRDHIIRGYDLFGNPVMRDSTLYAARLLAPSAALVFDNALFGWTGPVMGRRYRMEVAQAIGDFSYTNTTVDFRNYTNFRQRVVLASRLVMLNRFGRDADLFLDYWGGPYFLRGYNADSFSEQECADSRNAVSGTSVSSCPARDQLIGSNVALMNLELRFPVITELQLGWFANLPPVDALLFFDGGMAWSGEACGQGVASLIDCPPNSDKGMERTWRRDPGDDPFLVRQPLYSYGYGLRLNIMFAVLRFDWAYPLNRPDDRRVFSFSIGSSF